MQCVAVVVTAYAKLIWCGRKFDVNGKFPTEIAAIFDGSWSDGIFAVQTACRNHLEFLIDPKSICEHLFLMHLKNLK